MNQSTISQRGVKHSRGQTWTQSLRNLNGSSDSRMNVSGNQSVLLNESKMNTSSYNKGVFKIGEVKGLDQSITAKASNRSITRDYVSMGGKKVFNVVV